MSDTPINLEDQFGQDMMEGGFSATGEEEMLRIASEFALQLDADQIRAILFVENMGRRLKQILPEEGQFLLDWAREWKRLKKNNHSDQFINAIMGSISLRKFFNENTFKVNIEK